MASTDSEIVAGSLTLDGVWLHDPADPAGTAVNLRHGKAARSGSLSVESQASHYAGRVFPVVDYGPFEAETLRVSAVVEHGPGWFATVEAVKGLVRLRRLLVVRDNRGRAIMGEVSSGEDIDKDYGTDITFTVTRGEVA